MKTITTAVLSMQLCACIPRGSFPTSAEISFEANFPKVIRKGEYMIPCKFINHTGKQLAFTQAITHISLADQTGTNLDRDLKQMLIPTIIDTSFSLPPQGSQTYEVWISYANGKLRVPFGGYIVEPGSTRRIYASTSISKIRGNGCLAFQSRQETVDFKK